MMINPPLGPIDHSLLSLDYYCFLEKDSSDDPSGYSYCRGNYDSMREELDSPDWIGSLQDLSAQQAWDSMSNKIIGLIERYIPKKNILTLKVHPGSIGKLRQCVKISIKPGTNIIKTRHRKIWNDYTT